MTSHQHVRPLWIWCISSEPDWTEWLLWAGHMEIKKILNEASTYMYNHYRDHKYYKRIPCVILLCSKRNEESALVITYPIYMIRATHTCWLSLTTRLHIPESSLLVKRCTNSLYSIRSFKTLMWFLWQMEYIILALLIDTMSYVCIASYHLGKRLWLSDKR